MTTDQPALTRVLIANRGEIAKRLIAFFRAKGIETCVVFSEPDADQPYLDDADYAVYLNGKTVDETYMDPRRVLSAAMDAAADAIHPGYCFLAEHLDFYALCASANVAVIGTDPRVLAKVVDRVVLREAARHCQIPLIPATDPLPPEDDGVALAAQLGLPLFVKAVAGGALHRVERLADVPEAVARVRALALRATGNGKVYLERAVGHVRQIGTIVAADRHGGCYHLGEVDGSVQAGFRTWVEEMGPGLLPGDLHQKLGQAAVALAVAVGWVGVGAVRWALTPDGGWYLLGFSARLTTGYSLVEAVQGVDLVDAQLSTLLGEPLGWQQVDAHPKKHGLQLRVLHVDPSDLSRPEGVLETFTLPEGVSCEAGAVEGQLCTPDTDPLLVKITVTAPTRHAALVRARAALEELVIEGVANNREVLLQLLAEPAFWQGPVDTGTLSAFVAQVAGTHPPAAAASI
jgi:propionyl-CoA carboxylase alpha chain